MFPLRTHAAPVSSLPDGARRGVPETTPFKFNFTKGSRKEGRATHNSQGRKSATSLYIYRYRPGLYRYEGLVRSFPAGRTDSLEPVNLQFTFSYYIYSSEIGDQDLCDN
eukprot:5866487-Pyramimonas_sp.AAC.1